MAETVDIFITEVATGTKIQIPWLPDKIKFESGGTKFASYDILDLGEVLVPIGRNLRKVRWESKFPGEGHSDLPFLRCKPDTPRKYQGKFSQWKNSGTHLKLVITGTPINMDVYLYDYDVEYEGGAGDYSYDISFVDYYELKVTSTKVVTQTTQTKRPTTTTKKTTGRTHTVVSGDTLWNLAVKYYGKGSEYLKIYNANADVIEAAAKKHGKSSSSSGGVKGSWIFAGTVLQIP